MATHLLRMILRSKKNALPCQEILKQQVTAQHELIQASSSQTQILYRQNRYLNTVDSPVSREDCGTPTDRHPFGLQQLRRCFSSQSSDALSSQSEETIEQIQSRIFGNHIGDGLRSGRKVLARKLVGPKMVAYYPEDVFRNDPLLANLEAERAKHKLERLRRRGKAPPKKGSGKRATKKK
eukprot:jgi/Picsp_1/5371/NSC_02732-R1_protein